MRPRHEYGARVRNVRALRNDGTFPGEATGALLVRRGSVGYVRDAGTFLEDQLVYAVHFVDPDRVVGCRETELQSADAPWRPSRFEILEPVHACVALAIAGEVVAKPGDPGRVVKVLGDESSGVCYHVRFPGRTLQVPESALEPGRRETPA